MQYGGRFDIEKLISQISAERAPRIYFVGIGGVSVSSLAMESLRRGCAVAGSDRSRSDLTDRLEKLGAEVHIGHDGKNVTVFKPDMLVYSAAVHDDNPEMTAARENGIQPVSGEQLDL